MSDGINPNIKRNKKAAKSAETYLAKLQEGDRFALSEALTIIESETTEKQELAQQILLGTEGKKLSSIRIGITGSPGAGKSTLIEQLGLHYLDQGHKVAVLAVDPSSTKSYGSILGDKTRMNRLSNHPDAYVRPTASSAHLGGVGKHTHESMAICEYAGYDIILVESVGVGQSEIELVDLIDVYVLVLLPGGGDDIQGIKRGVVERADILVINKSDKDRQLLARQSQKDFEGSVKLFDHDMQNWNPPVLLTSALENEGIDKLAKKLDDFIDSSKANGHFQVKRKDQQISYIRTNVERYIVNKIAERLSSETDIEKRIDDDQTTFQITKEIKEELVSKFKM